MKSNVCSLEIPSEKRLCTSLCRDVKPRRQKEPAHSFRRLNPHRNAKAACPDHWSPSRLLSRTCTAHSWPLFSLNLSMFSPCLQQTAAPACFPSIPTKDSKIQYPIAARVIPSLLSSPALLQERAAFIHSLALSPSFHSFSLLPLLQEVLLSKYPCQLFSTCSDVISCSNFPQSDLISCG